MYKGDKDFLVKQLTNYNFKINFNECFGDVTVW